MQFAINIPNFGIYSDPRVVAELTHEAEESGWDGFFIWDHIAFKLEDYPETQAMADPWITLAAMAMRTKRIKIGPMVTPLPRRRPWQVAREAVTLDHLSNGRLILGIGLGSDHSREFSSFGEETDAKKHGEMLDEGLEIVKGLWSGEEFSYDGKHYQISRAHFLPKPQQQPRIPLWIAGFWPNKKPFRRAAQWDGVFPLIRERDMTPTDYRDVLGYMRSQRALDTTFDVVSGQISGPAKATDAATIAAFAEAGATWWQEYFDWEYTIEQVRHRIRQGPPTL